MTSSIEVTGADGESIVFDGATVAKFTHHGKLETARNPVSTYREVRIKDAHLAVRQAAHSEAHRRHGQRASSVVDNFRTLFRN